MPGYFGVLTNPDAGRASDRMLSAAADPAKNVRREIFDIASFSQIDHCDPLVV
jgi:hypothetical protein